VKKRKRSIVAEEKKKAGRLPKLKSWLNTRAMKAAYKWYPLLCRQPVALILQI